MKGSGRVAEIADKRTEFIVEHAGENNPGKRAGIQNDPFGSAGAVLFHGGKQKFKIERRVVGHERQVAAKVGQTRHNRFNAGLIRNHIVGNAVDRRGFQRNRPSGIDERAEGINRAAVAEADGTDFHDSIVFGLNTGGFQVKCYKVHGNAYSGYARRSQGLAPVYSRCTLWLAIKREVRMKKTAILGMMALSAIMLCGCRQETATSNETQEPAASEETALWQTDYDAALKQAAAENKYV